MMRRRAVVIAFLATALAACGARVDPALRAKAVGADLGAGGGTVQKQLAGTDAGDAGTGTGDATATGGGATTGAGGGAGGATGGSGTNAGSGAGATGGGAAACKSTGATDVGVTANQITVGTVADLSGPVPGLFQAAPYGAEAYFAYINSQGGVCGRKLKITTADSQTDCTANQNAHVNLLPKVFAFVGSFALYDDCGTSILKQHPDVPDLSYALGFDTKRNTVSNFPPQVAPVGYQDGMFCYWRDKYGDKVKHVGSIYGNLPASASSEKMIENAAVQGCGWHWDFSIPAGATDTTFDAEISKMCQGGVQIIFLIATTGQNAGEMKREADDQNCHPIWIIPISYASDFIDRLGSAAQAEGIQGHSLYSMFFTKADADNIPEVALFQKWYKATHPGAGLELYAMYSWVAAKLFVQALRAIGPNVTRKALIEHLRTITAWDGDGLVNRSNLSNHTASNCYILWQIHNGEYQRVDTPANAYRCDHEFINYNG